ncbi:MAG: flagellar hook-length control protein FliK [Lachnospiraceae bacterium]|nr:flagellar hook-length control protein FliK [Lachnospiraceae bacterium]
MEKTNGAVNLLNLTAQAGLANLPNIGAKAQSTSDVSFKDTLMKTSEVKPIDAVKTDVTSKKTVVETNQSAMNKNIVSKNETTTNNNESLDEDDMVNLKEEISKIVDEIKDKIKEEFSVSDEDIEKAMEILGITNSDLFNATDLRSLAMELTETKDSIELLTNVELYDGIKEVTALAENLFSEVSEEFNIPEEKLTEIINSDSFENVLVNAKSEITTEDTMVDNIEVGTEETDAKVLLKEEKAEENMPIVEAEETSVVVTKAETENETVKAISENKSDKVSVEDKKQPEVIVEIEKTEGVRTSNPVQTESFSQNNDSMKQNQNQESKKQNLFDNSKGQEVNLSNTQTVTTQTVNSVGDIVETVTSYSTYADTENIMRQVTDYVRVNITEDVTEMEIRLHPASLGTVNMQINSQNGQITAHLTVQNELVKSVLESQMIKLQETFNEQGTKVTSIEVTVANYNLDSKSDNNYSQERENQSGQSKGRKSINLNEIGSFDELTDEEQLEAEVMEMNGSSVNYTA